jgi:EAL domain-containing protein (putative c-di-GMP-specific phosphodiesterase class I)
MFVNSSKFEIYGIGDLLKSMQRIRDIAPSTAVVLEINEKAAADTNELPVLRDSLKKLNMGIAFDDFGVGQTRLVELSKTPPDYLKFDISLIRQIHLAPKRLHQMVSTFIQAAHDLGILTLAEGIECSEESEVCQQIGFDLGQGYFFGKPAPIHAI